MSALRPLAAAALALLVACPVFGEGSAPPAKGPDVTITIVRVRATGALERGAQPTVEKALAAYRSRIEALNSRHAAFEHAGTLKVSATFGERTALEFGSGGSLAITPTPAESAGLVLLRIEETPPGADAPCMRTVIETAPRVPAAVFCDRVPADGTLIFFVTTEPAGR